MVNVRKLYLRWKHNRMLKYLSDKHDFLTERAQCLTVLEALNTKQFAMYHSTDGIGVIVETPFLSIDAYTDALRSAAKNAAKSKVISGVGQHDLRSGILDNFFVSKSGHYQDVEKAVCHLRQAGIDFCKSMEVTDDAEYGVDEYNKRAATLMFVNLRKLIITLAEVSLAG